MRATVATILSLTICCSLFAAKPKKVRSLSTNDRIIAAERKESKAFEVLEYLTDNIGPRLSGSKGAEAAVRWTTAKFEEWGYEAKNEAVVVPHWVRGAEEGSLLSHLDQKIVLTALGGSVATPEEGITAEVIDVHSFDELKTLGEKVRGKIVLFDVALNVDKVRSGRAFEAYSEAVIYRGTGASKAAELGAVASLVRSVGSASLRTPHTGSVRYDEKVAKIPAGAVTIEDAGLIHRLTAKGEKVVMHLRLTPQLLPEVPSANVVVDLKGSTNPEEIVLIGGHLDSWDLGTGAIDDGSGAAMVMETMRLLKMLKLKPKRTIRAVLYMNEENGLRGGKGYAEAHKDELKNHIAAIETDAGAAPPLGFQTSLPAEWIEKLKPRLTELSSIHATALQHADETGADTSPLTDAGVAGFGLAPDPLHYFDYHHTPADTLDKVDPKELADDSAALAVMAWTVANLNERLPVVPPKPEKK